MKKHAFAVALSLALSAASAHADDQAVIEQRNAQARFDEGLALANKGQHEEARVKFVQAYAVLKVPDVLYNLAVAEKKSIHPVESMRHFRTLAADPKTPPDLIARARKFMDELGRVTAHVTVHAPDGADILVDGEVVARAPTAQPVDVLAGNRTFSISLKGNDAKQAVSLTEGQSSEITLSFPTPPGGGDVKPPPGGGLPPATRTETYRPGAGWIAPAVLGGLGLVGLGVGVGFGAASQGATNERDAMLSRGICAASTLPQCSGYSDKIDAVNADRLVSIVGYVSGVTLLAASAISFMVWPKHERSVTITPQGLGLAVVGSF